jgi:cytochrome c5
MNASASAWPCRVARQHRRVATAFIATAVLLAPLPALAQPAKAAAPSGGRDGRTVYEAVCAACHTTGVLKAPKLGDTAAWRPLIAEGQRSLVRTAVKGIRQMPPKGGDPSLSAIEVERAVVYMANAAGGRFKDPP